MASGKNHGISSLKDNKFHRFYGTFVGYETKRPHDPEEYFDGFIPTVSLKDIKVENEDGRIVRIEYIEADLTMGMVDLGILNYGEKLSFDGKVSSHEEGYRGVKLEVMLSNPPRTVYTIDDIKNVKLEKSLVGSDERKFFPEDSGEISYVIREKINKYHK